LAIGACFPGPLSIAEETGRADAEAEVGETDTSLAEVVTRDAEGEAVQPEIEVEVAECGADGDCDRLDAACVEGRCDGGRCIGEPLSGSGCDDGLRCTTGDVCTAGVCAGTAVVCAAIDACHKAGVCDPGTGACSNPFKDDGTACDDGDGCTYADTCRAGVCAPGRTPNDLNGDVALGFSGDGSVRAQSLAFDTDGDIKLLLLVEGSELRLDAMEPEGVTLHPMPDGATRTVVVVELRKSTMDIRSVQVVAYTTSPDAILDGSRGLAILPDGSMVVAGAFDGSFLLGADGSVPAGESPSGFSIRDGVYVARWTATGSVVWHREYLGALGAVDEIAVPLVRSAGTQTTFGFSVPPGRVLEVVRDGHSIAVESPRLDGFSVYEAFTINGETAWRGTIEPAGGEGFAYLVDISKLDETTWVVTGATEGGATAVTVDGESAPEVPIPTGVGDTSEAWLARVQVGPMPFRHFWATYLDRFGVAMPTASTPDGSWIALDIVGRLFSRGPDQHVADHATPGRRRYALARLDPVSLEVSELRHGPGFAFISRMVNGLDGGVILSGHYDGEINLGDTAGPTVFETHQGQGLALVALGNDTGPTFGVNLATREGIGPVTDPDRLDPLPVLVRGDGVIVVAGTAIHDAVVGVTAIAPPSTGNTFGAFVLRLNSEGALACPAIAP